MNTFCSNVGMLLMFLIAVLVFTIVIAQLTRTALRKHDNSRNASRLARVPIGLDMILVRILLSTLQLNVATETLPLNPSPLIVAQGAFALLFESWFYAISPMCFARTAGLGDVASLFAVKLNLK